MLDADNYQLRTGVSPFPHVAWNFATFGGNFREVLILLIRGPRYSNLASSVGLKLQKSCPLYMNWWNPIWSYLCEIDNNNIGVTHAFINLFMFCNAKYRQRVSLICLLVTLQPLRLLPTLKLKSLALCPMPLPHCLLIYHTF